MATKFSIPGDLALGFLAPLPIMKLTSVNLQYTRISVLSYEVD